jgi:hypothetical protein
MPVLALNNGQHVLWEPTTDFICSGCRQPLDRVSLYEDTLESVNFVYDLTIEKPDAIARGAYWYLHKRCARLEDMLHHYGVQVLWGMHPILWILGLDPLMNRLWGNLAKDYAKRMPPGVYQQLYAQWIPSK